VSVLIIDDHLLGDIIGDMIPQPLVALLRHNGVATTNLYYVRLCRAALASRGGALTASWSAERRQQAAQALIALSPDIEIMPIQTIAFRMAELARDHRLSPKRSQQLRRAADACVSGNETIGRTSVLAAEPGSGVHDNRS
jgi:hypothetical protein